MLESLTYQTDNDFEIILVEDGSTEPCKEAAEKYAGKLNLQYHYKSNEGRSIARNYGILRANGEYFVFVDSDCVLEL